MLLKFLLLTAFVPALMGCTLTIRSAADLDRYTGIGSGVIDITEADSLAGVCTLVDGVPQTDCEREIDPGKTVVLRAIPSAGSEFAVWTGDCDVITATECTITFNKMNVVSVVATFRRLSCQGFGTDACFSSGLKGEGSCNGDAACRLTAGPVGNASCNGSSTCNGSTGSIGNNSCNGPGSSCFKATGAVGNDSCNGNNACRESAAAVGNHSCNSGCLMKSGVIGDNSCNENDACRETTVNIASNSCVGNDACNHSLAAVGTNSCNGNRACQQTSGAIGANSCNGDLACNEWPDPVGDCQRNTIPVPACSPPVRLPVSRVVQ